MHTGPPLTSPQAVPSISSVPYSLPGRILHPTPTLIASTPLPGFFLSSASRSWILRAASISSSSCTAPEESECE